MSTPSTARNIFLALVLSFMVSFLLAVMYTFYPLMAAVVSNLAVSHAGARSGGVGAVAGGVSGSFLSAALVTAPALFLGIFVLLQRRRVPR